MCVGPIQPVFAHDCFEKASRGEALRMILQRFGRVSGPCSLQLDLPCDLSNSANCLYSLFSLGGIVIWQ